MAASSSVESENPVVVERTEPQVSTRYRRRPAVLAALIAALVALSGCAGPFMANLNADEARLPVPSVEPMEKVPVYYLGSEDNQDRLYRETRETRSMTDPIAAAVSAMTRLKPLDPHYRNFWHPATLVSTSLQDQNITVDLSADAFTTKRKLTKRQARQSVQQLVHTATAAAAGANLADGLVSVTVLVDGKPNYDAWDRISLGRPMERDARARAPLWITSPVQDQRIDSSTVSVTGNGWSPRAELRWEISDGSQTAIRSGSVRVPGNPMTPGNFTFTAELPAGSYSVSVFDVGDPVPAASAEDPDSTMPERIGARTFVDSKAFEVVPAGDR